MNHDETYNLCDHFIKTIKLMEKLNVEQKNKKDITEIMGKIIREIIERPEFKDEYMKKLLKHYSYVLISNRH